MTLDELKRLAKGADHQGPYSWFFTQVFTSARVVVDPESPSTEPTWNDAHYLGNVSPKVILEIIDRNWKLTEALLHYRSQDGEVWIAEEVLAQYGYSVPLGREK